MRRAPAPLGALALALAPAGARAAELDGAALAPWWGLPFAGLLLSIALGPLVAPAWWHRHDAKVAIAWALLFLLPFGFAFGLPAVGATLVHALLAEYLPFIALLAALYTVAGGIFVRGNLHGSPGLNTGLLALGALLASCMGTTGASMLLLRPLIRANDNRAHQAHVVIFFILIVSNIGGSLTPLGDPPLFLGFLQGVDFFWTVSHILPETLFLVAVLLAVFWCVDRHYWRREGALPVDPTPDSPAGLRGLGVDGARNFWLLGAIVALVLMSGIWKSAPVFDVHGTPVGLAAALRDAGLVAVALLSLAVTPRRVHEDNRFSWAPMKEVATLFIGIFLTIVPVIAMLKAGAAGPFAAVVAAVTGPGGQPEPAMYFWATGLLSAFLDNAPTYLVFFNTAGGDAQALMTRFADTLAAISSGAVFMGALTYIGNAPNLMVKSIAQDRGIAMPGFFGYMAWSCTLLLPLFALVTLIWYR